MQDVIALIIQYKYLILFPLATIEGPIVCLVAGLLSSLGYLEFAAAFVIVLAGDLIPDIAYFYVGRHAGNRAAEGRLGKHLAFLARHARFLEGLWRDHGRKTMLLSKLAYGLSAPLLMSAGMTRMPLRRYIAYVMPVAIAKCAAIMALGYFLVQSYINATQYLRNAGILFAVLLVLLIAGYIFIAVRARRGILELEQEASYEP